MPLSFRPATPEDYEFARFTHHAAYRQVVTRQFGKWDEGMQDGFFAENWGEGPMEIVLFGGERCGYLGVDHKADHVYVREIVILPAYQGKGIGTRILQGLQVAAAVRGIPVRLQVLIANDRARRLYERVGFVQTGSTFTHVMMQWEPENRVIRPVEKKPKTHCSI